MRRKERCLLQNIQKNPQNLFFGNFYSFFQSTQYTWLWMNVKNFEVNCLAFCLLCSFLSSIHDHFLTISTSTESRATILGLFNPTFWNLLLVGAFLSLFYQTIKSKNQFLLCFPLCKQYFLEDKHLLIKWNKRHKKTFASIVLNAEKINSYLNCIFHNQQQIEKSLKR